MLEDIVLDEDLTSLNNETTEIDVQTASPHESEREILRFLLNHADCEFETLFVHRTPTGFCLQGVMKSGTDRPNLSELVRTFCHAEEIIDQVVTCTDGLPKK